MTESPLTIASLTDEVLDTAQGYVRGQDLRTSTASSFTSTDLTFTVVDGTQLSVGPVEVDDELVQVASVDTTSNTVTIEPWGRGLGGTTAAAHSGGARVTVAPIFPRQRVRNTIYGILREIFPDIFAVATTTLDGSAVRTNFTMPADCYHVLRIETKLYGPSLMWQPVPRWRQNKQGSSVEVEIIGPVTVGSGRVRVLYVKSPPATFTATDDLVAIGYDYSVRDLIVLGASARLMAFTETSRVQAQSMEAHGRGEVVPPGSAAALSRILDSRFQQRVLGEKMQLLNRYPTQPHFTR